MEQDIHHMESPRCETKEIIAQHEADVHKGPVIVGADSLKCPYIGGKYLLDEPRLSDPRVLHHLGDVVVDKPVTDGVAIDRTRHRYDGQELEQSIFIERRPLCQPSFWVSRVMPFCCLGHIRSCSSLAPCTCMHQAGVLTALRSRTDGRIMVSAG